MIKRAVSFILSLSLLTCSTSQIYAFDHVAIPQNIHLPTPPSSIQAHSSELSFKSFEAKIKPKKEKAKLAGTYSGTCGYSVNWNLDTSTGVLTISGSGDITNYDFEASVFAPWYTYRNYIKTVAIENGVQNTGNSAFYNCNELSTITLPSSIKVISYASFYNCIGLTSVTMPDFIDHIGEWVFRYCHSLTSIRLPKNLAFIWFGQFEYSGLTSVVIPLAVEHIAENAFGFCSNLKSVTMSGIVNHIGKNAFKSTGLTEVTIPSSVKFIGSYAFFDCSALTAVTYKGLGDPGAEAAGVFAHTQVPTVNVPWNYNANTFCGMSVSRPPAPTGLTPTSTSSPVTPTRSPTSQSPHSNVDNFSEWFINNVAWLTPVLTFVGAVLGLLIKYNDVKNFCLSNCCHKESETTETGTLDEKLL